MPAPTTAATQLLCLLGHPVGHSASPQLHSAALAHSGVDAVYLAFDVPPEGLAQALAGLRAIAGWRGANVTIPHKLEALRLAERATPAAAAVGAANTLTPLGDGNVEADNTDVEGVAGVLEALGVGADPAVVVGTGGAARAVAWALGRRGAAVRVVGRHSGRVAAVEDLVRRAGGTLAADHPHVLVVNATPLGRRGEPLPDEWMRLGEGQIAFDLNYGPEPSPFLAAAARGGARAVDGMGMLAGQARASFGRWTGIDVPLDVFIRAAQAVKKLGPYADEAATPPTGATSR